MQRTLHTLEDGPSSVHQVGDLAEFVCQHGNYGIHLVAELSENTEVFEIFREHGCQECTGYARGYMAALRENPRV